VNAVKFGDTTTLRVCNPLSSSERNELLSMQDVVVQQGCNESTSPRCARCRNPFSIACSTRPPILNIGHFATYEIDQEYVVYFTSWMVNAFLVIAEDGIIARRWKPSRITHVCGVEARSTQVNEARLATCQIIPPLCIARTAFLYAYGLMKIGERACVQRAQCGRKRLRWCSTNSW
jgi:hypothetical protein